LASHIDTARCSLREFAPEDADSLLKIFGNADAMRFSPMPMTQDRAAAIAVITWHAENYRQFGFSAWAVIEKETRAFIGQAGLLPHDIGVELFYSITPEYWGRGFATEVACACRDYAFEKLGQDTLIALIHPDHVRAANVARKVGMRETGMVRRWERENRAFEIKKETTSEP
jgi:RimJ/RimL family protein N-acetyltransferase